MSSSISRPAPAHFICPMLTRAENLSVSVTAAKIDDRCREPT